jgi:hypothetical protein
MQVIIRNNLGVLLNKLRLKEINGKKIHCYMRIKKSVEDAKITNR